MKQDFVLLPRIKNKNIKHLNNYGTTNYRCKF